MNEKLKTGDRIVHTQWQIDRVGVVAKANRVYPLIRWDGESSDMLENINDLRLETQDDIERRAQETAMRTWREDQPPAHLVSVTHVSYSNVGPTGVQFFRALNTPEDMLTAADELTSLAHWFAARPKS